MSKECVELTSQDGSAVFLLDMDMQQVKFARFKGSEQWTTLTLPHNEDNDEEEGGQVPVHRCTCSNTGHRLGLESRQ